MKPCHHIVYICALLLCLAATATAQGREQDGGALLRRQLERHVYTLADDSMQGRRALSAGSVMAADYIEGQFREAGLSPWEGSYSQYFTLSQKYALFAERGAGTGVFKNIVGLIEGSDPALKDEYIVIGAHYDHLGTADHDGRRIVYNGADDNASGTAILIEVARRLAAARTQLGRSVLIVAFDGEELGLYGSYHFANHPSAGAGSVRMAVSIDMVGWYGVSGELRVEGAGTIRNGFELLGDPSILPQGLNVNLRRFETDPLTATDTQPFAANGIPTLAVTTGLESPYHEPEDDPGLIDYDGMALITEYLAAAIGKVASESGLAASGRTSYKHGGGGRLLEFGVMLSAGSNYHEMTSGPLRGKSTSAYGAGLTMRTRLARNLSLGTGIIYERVGAQYTGGDLLSDNLTLPLNIGSRTRGVVRLFVSAGGYYRYTLRGTVGGRSGVFDDTFCRNEFGAEYSVGLTMGRVSAGTTRRHGLTDMLRNGGDGPNVRNRSVQIFLSYTF